MSLPACKHRGEQRADGKVACLSNRIIHREPGWALPGTCQACPYIGQENSADAPPVILHRGKPIKSVRGPGWHMTALIAEYGLGGSHGCGCAEFARQMDEWGISGCRDHRSEIVGRLEEKFGEILRANQTALMQAGAAALWNGLPLTIGGLFDEALHRTEAN